MSWITTPQLKKKFLQELKASSFEEYDQQQQKQDIKNLTITYILFSKVQPVIRNIFQKYFPNLNLLIINNCDLRTFEGFPTLPSLKDLDVENNNLQGSFEFVVKNRNISYINASKNIISDLSRLQPLIVLKKLRLCIKNNPVASKNIRSLGIKVIQIPRIFKKQEEKEQEFFLGLQKKDDTQSQIQTFFNKKKAVSHPKSLFSNQKQPPEDDIQHKSHQGKKKSVSIVQSALQLTKTVHQSTQEKFIKQMSNERRSNIGQFLINRFKYTLGTKSKSEEKQPQIGPRSFFERSAQILEMNNLAKEDRPFILEDLSKSSAINEIVVDSESSSEPDSFSEIEYNGSDEDLDNDEEYQLSDSQNS